MLQVITLFMTQISGLQFQSKLHSGYVCVCGVGGGGFGGEGLSLQPNFKKGGGLDRTSTFTGGCWERGGDIFREGCNCHIINEI